MTALAQARQLRADGQTYAQIGAALSLHRITVSRMLRTGQEAHGGTLRPFLSNGRLAPWLRRQLELARHRKYKGLHV
jgi:hypothetical protein